MESPEDISEIPRKLPRRDASYYLTLLLFVGPIWAVTPLAWCYAAWNLVSRTYFYNHLGMPSVFPDIASRTLLLWSWAEIIFSLYYAYLAYTISPPSTLPPADAETLQKVFYRLLQSGLASLPNQGAPDDERPRPFSPGETVAHMSRDDPRAADFRDRLRTWFGGVPFSQISQHDVEKWLHWSCFNAAPPSTASENDEPKSKIIHDALALLAHRCGTTFTTESKKSNPVTTMCLTLDQLHVVQRPLTWYLFVWVVNKATRLWLKYVYGARLERFGEFEYMIRYPTRNSRPKPLDQSPVVFIHGLGLGLFQYFTFITHLFRSSPHRAVIIPIQPHISQDIFHPRYLKPMHRSELMTSFRNLVETLGWAQKGLICVSHSNGSYAHAWLLKENPDLIKRNCFVDPVTFCSWEGDVCYNFVYRPCTNGVNLVLRFFVGTELGVANLIQRHFDWTSNSLFFEEIPEGGDLIKTMYVVGGRDSILNAERVCNYLTSHGVSEGLKFFPKYKHGESLIVNGDGVEAVCNWLTIED